MSTSGEKPELGRSDIEEMKEWFSFFDKDGNKKLDRDELRMVFHAMCWSVTNDELDEIFKSADADDSGFIDYDEYLDLLQTFRKDPNKEKAELMQAFRTFYKSSSGYVHRKELKKLLVSRDMAFSDTEKLLDKADVNGDGKIKIEDFVDLMLEKPACRASASADSST